MQPVSWCWSVWVVGAIFASFVATDLAMAASSVQTLAAFADPGEINIGYRWMIDGDENLNATCTTRYRKLGETTWQLALHAWRFHPWISPSEDTLGTNHNVIEKAENRFAGSVFWVEPGETYEIELTLADPDGVTGPNPVILTTTTWREMVPSPTGCKLYVVPGSGGGHAHGGRSISGCGRRPCSRSAG